MFKFDGTVWKKVNGEELVTIKKKEITLSELQEVLRLDDIRLGRQHGKTGKVYTNDEEEFTRLWNNWVSRVSRNSRTELNKKLDVAVNQINASSDDRACDKYGISPQDERVYRRQFKFLAKGEHVTRAWVKMRLGLNLKQIEIMQERTQLYPYPPVSKKEVAIDEKKRWETGNIY